MISACRDDDGIAFPGNVFFRTIEDEFCFTFFNPEELVHLFVHLVPDFLAFLQAHQDELGVFAGEYHLAEIIGSFQSISRWIQRNQSYVFLLVWLLEGWANGVMERYGSLKIL